MRQKILLLSVAVIAAVTFTSCEKEPGELNHYTTESSGPTPALEGFDQLVVNTPDAVVLDDANSFKFEWESGDIIAIYEVDGEWAANFKIADAATTIKSFQAMNEARLDDDKYYVALYPAPKSGEEGSYDDYMAAATLAGVTQKQEGATCDHLKERCYMSVAFKGDDAITFNFASAFAAVNFQVSAGETPTSLKFADAEKSYRVDLANLSEAVTDEDSFTAYLVIDPATAESRTQQIFVPAGAGAPVRTIEDCTDIYSAGVSYSLSTFTVEEYNEVTVLMPAAISDEESFAWADNDVISIYNSGVWVADGKYSSTSSTFVIEGGVTLDNQTTYVAVFPQADSQQSLTKYEAAAATKIANQIQIGNTAAHLKNAGWLKSTAFKCTAATEVEMKYQNSYLSLTFDMEDSVTPSSLSFVDGSNIYNLTFDSATTAAEHIAYLAINPTTTESRSQLLTIIDSDSKQKKYTATSTVEYVVGELTAIDCDSELTTTNIIEIGSPEALLEYMAAPTVDAVLIDNINMEGKSYTPAAYLASTFDGASYTISNLTISDESSTKGTGLFQGLNGGAVVKNLTLDSPVIKAKSYAGAIAGKVMANATIENCTVINGQITVVEQYAGGIVGQCTGEVKGCSFGGSVVSEVSKKAANAGGISGGANSGSRFIDCHNSGSVTISHNNAGGIVGQVFGGDLTSQISGCTNSGTISSSNVATGIGGMVGYCGDEMIICGCSNSGTIEGIAKVGGIVGSLTGGGDIVACFNTGFMGKAGFTTGSTAGIAGEAKATTTITSCYNMSEFGKATDGGNNGQISGYVNGAVSFTLTCGYYVAAEGVVSAKGERLDDIAALNAKVEEMNQAINATTYNEYNFVAGEALATDLPTLK